MSVALEKLIGGARTEVTDERGEALFLTLGPGSYEVSAALHGFATQERTDVARWEQALALWMPADLASSSDIDADPGARPSGCGAECDDTSNVLELSWGVAPDIVTLAKSFAGGMPLSAVIGRAELMNKPHVGGLGGTYGGNPVALASAMTVMSPPSVFASSSPGLMSPNPSTSYTSIVS